MLKDDIQFVYKLSEEQIMMLVDLYQQETWCRKRKIKDVKKMLEGSWVLAEFAIGYEAETNQMYLEVDEYSTIKDALEGKETVFYNTLIQLFGNDMPGVLNLIDHMWHEVEDDSITKDLECNNNNVTIHSSKGVNNKVILQWEAINNVQ